MLPILFVLALTFVHQLLEKVSLFQKISFKIKVLKTFKISSDCQIKTCRSLKRTAF